MWCCARQHSFFALSHHFASPAIVHALCHPAHAQRVLSELFLHASAPLLQAADAFKAGGGGKRAEMKRLLAEAAVARRASGSKASTSGRADAPAAAAGGSGQKAAAAGEKDWRLQAPAKRHMPEFKPGGWSCNGLLAQCMHLFC